MIRILFVEDDELIASGLAYALGREGYGVVHCPGVARAREELASGEFSLGLLDLSLPDGTGYSLCGELRERGIPVIFLTAVDDEGNVVRGLEMGAEDYVTKPFRLGELLARIKNVLRRSGAAGAAQGVISLAGDVHIHPLQARVLRQGREVELTALEYRLLLTLANNRGQVLSRGQLLEGIWDAGGSFVGDNTLTVYVKRLREKLGDSGGEDPLIETVRGLGYRLRG